MSFDYGNNPVNHPAHYTKGDVECIDAIKASMTDEEFQGYLKGNALKYLWRYKDKNNPAEDLRKAQWYINRLINEIDKSNTTDDSTIKPTLLPCFDSLDFYRVAIFKINETDSPERNIFVFLKKSKRVTTMITEDGVSLITLRYDSKDDIKDIYDYLKKGIFGIIAIGQNGFYIRIYDLISIEQNNCSIVLKAKTSYDNYSIRCIQAQKAFMRNHDLTTITNHYNYHVLTTS